MDRSALDALLLQLTDAQREAVVHSDGPLLVLAGPGSGKTRVITCRVAHLIAQGVPSGAILAITFTNKAAGEMKQRVSALLPGNRVWISTFHSFGVRILRQYADRVGLDRNFTIYDQADRTRVVKSALESAGIDKVHHSPDAVGAAISKAKNQLLLPAEYARVENDFFGQVVAQVYVTYEKKMRDQNALDFDDLLLWPALALQNDAELRADLDARFRYVLIDEYQDTNKSQYAIARGLSQDYPNLCVVGDPNQSIYRWRGADIRNILGFERDYPAARVVRLAENFRSTQRILHAADRLIAHNKERKDMTLHTANAEGKKPEVLLFETGLDEADQLAQRIGAAVAAGERHYRDFAILMRVNALTRSLETAFVRRRVPFQIVRGLAFFDRKENRDVLAYLRLLVNPRDDISFQRVVNEPARGVGKTSLEHLQAYAEPRELSLLAAAAEVDKIPAIKGKAATGLKYFVFLMRELRPLLEGAPHEVIRQVLERSGYRRMLRESKEPEDQERLANVEEVVTAAHQFYEEDNSRTIADFLENITLASDVDGWDDKQDCVAMMTLHAAKGLEFPVVYLLAAEQGILPHERSIAEPAQLEEERRLAFVGMTRAKEELYLTHCRLREFRGQTLYAVPSMFLDELPEDGVEDVDLSASAGGTQRAMEAWRGATAGASSGWYDTGFTRTATKAKSEEPRPAGGYAVGALVMHATYGVGKITNVTGMGASRKLKIRFSSGERTFIADKAKLSIVQG
jgi:DNA helicase II / ATP-dependent DNA helicase PcrA